MKKFFRLIIGLEIKKPASKKKWDFFINFFGRSKLNLAPKHVLFPKNYRRDD